MARPADISLQDVKKACEQIRSLEQRPTVDRVRAILKKGGRTTINRFLREYLKSEEVLVSKINFDIKAGVLTKLKEALQISESENVDKIRELEGILKEKDQFIQEILKESEEREGEFQSQATQLRAVSEKFVEVERENSRVRIELEAKVRDIKSLLEYKEKFIAQKSRNDTVAEQIIDYKDRIKLLEKDNRDLLERALKAES